MTQTAWQSYEELARHLLNQMAQKFGLQRVEGKQTIPGGRSGTDWEIDAKGVRYGDEAFVIIECRKTKSRQKQSQIGALAYSIDDTGADGGIVVTPVPLQEGAAKIAQAENIQHVTLSANSSIDSFMLRFLNDVFIGVTERIGPATDQVTAVRSVSRHIIE